MAFKIALTAFVLVVVVGPQRTVRITEALTVSVSTVLVRDIESGFVIRESGS